MKIASPMRLPNFAHPCKPHKNQSLRARRYLRAHTPLFASPASPGTATRTPATASGTVHRRPIATNYPKVANSDHPTLRPAAIAPPLPSKPLSPHCPPAPVSNATRPTPDLPTA
ncbi:exported hypothetical protein [Candidatus Sulfopaludibacter sp. SbA4]|nr:exported hypothetical protein [Candidatus Sulfopaludibacter sp. SbA4]